jgi:hypothetical protein
MLRSPRVGKLQGGAASFSFKLLLLLRTLPFARSLANGDRIEDEQTQD